MKLIYKIFPALSVVTLAVAPIVSTTSCSCSFELNLIEQQQYIYNRTFSIMAGKAGKYVFGTGWIVSDATKNDSNDYCYWLATNWHVQHKMETTLKSDYDYYYADNSLINKKDYVDYSRYCKFNSFAYEKPEDNFVYKDFIASGYVGVVDLIIAKVDFTGAPSDIKKKLDDLNSFQKQKGYINKFVKSDDSAIKNKDKIIGGYPMYKESESWFGGKWEAHSFAANNLKYYDKLVKYDEINYGHAVGDPKQNQDGSLRSGTEDYNYWDISPQYVFKNDAGNNFMSGGASGSMMITRDYEVCGIYWGGWEVTSSKQYYPAFTLFNTDDKNFLEKYTK